MNFSNLIYLEASGNYTIFHWNEGSKNIFSYTLKHFENQLSSDLAFSRIHRKFLVNKKFIIYHDNNEVLLTNGIRLPVARRRSI